MQTPTSSSSVDALASSTTSLDQQSSQTTTTSTTTTECPPSALDHGLTQSTPRRDTSITPRPFSRPSEFAASETIDSRDESSGAAAPMSDQEQPAALADGMSGPSVHPDSNSVMLEELRKRMGETLMNQQRRQRLAAQNYQASAQASVSVSDSGVTDSDTNMTPNTSDEKVPHSAQASSGPRARPPALSQRALVTPLSLDIQSAGDQDVGFSHRDTTSDANAATDAAHSESQSHQRPQSPQPHSPRGSKSRKRVSRHPYTADMLKRMNDMPAGSFGAAAADFLPLGAEPILDNPSYPTPNLYDLCLLLSADPGLDRWWANVVPILKTHYRAERLTLAVPGDATDLENAPWLQKATYSIYGNDYQLPTSPPPVSKGESEKPSKGRFNDDPKEDGNTLKYTKSVTGNRRPKLMGRHSFAGHTSNFAERWSATEETPGTPTPLKARHSRRKSSSGEFKKPRKHLREDDVMPDACEQAISPSGILPRNRPRRLSCGELPEAELPESASRPSSPSAVVFPTPRALEVEPEPLIKRTGVVKLFGRTKPIALTREYPRNSPREVSSDATTSKHKDVVQPTPRSETPGAALKASMSFHRSTPLTPSLASTQEHRGIPKSIGPDHQYPILFDPSPPAQKYEDYEQTPPSPWSQSPAPSPAPLSKPDVNPFFAKSYSEVDEHAFAYSPPRHDYSEPSFVEAIGVDRARTIIHIPLIRSASSRQGRSDTLQFPVAVISMSTSIIPYPSNLRSSLALLLPHLTTSFCLAQQYSQLEKQNASSCLDRAGHLLGLGGTFSDANSELELIHGLTSHVSYTSPLSQVGSDSAAEGYFGAKGPTTNEAIAASGMTAVNNSAQGTPNEGLTIHMSPSQRKSAFDELASRDPGLVHTSSITETPPRTSQNTPQMLSDYSRHSSTGSFTAPWHREKSSRPFPDTVAQLMLNSIPLHLFLAKPLTGEVIWTNAKFDAYRRSQPLEPRVRDPWQNVHVSDHKLVLNQWTRALRTGSQFTERVRVRRFNDESEYRWFIFRANPLISATGELLYWIGSFLDVHEQHIAERKAAQEREMFATNVKFRALANSIPQIVFEAAETRGLISVNEQWVLYTGQSLDEAMTLGFAKYIHRDDLEKCGILSPPQVLPESNDIPDFAHIIANGKLSEAFKQAERHYKKASSSSPPSSTSPPEQSDGPFRVFSNGVTSALQELVKRDIVTIQRDENGRDSYTTEIRLRSRKGDFRWHLVRLVKVETPNFGSGEASWYGTCTDINDRKLLERELSTALHQLNREMESKTRFFSNMSHEIRTPLNGILGTIPYIFDTTLDGDQRRMLDTIQNSSTNLRELVDNILDVSRVEAGKMNIVKKWFHLRSLLEDVIDTISSRAIDKGLELNYIVENDVPDTVYGDRFRIRQVLINLMGNAVKFTSQGEICTRCSIYANPDKIELKPSEILLSFEVIDTGKGFSPADAERLMQRFSQIESNGSQHAGSGLGLFLSKQLVELHGGELTPSSRVGRGAKFSFYIIAGGPSPQHPPSPEYSCSSQIMEIFNSGRIPASILEEIVAEERALANPNSEYYTSPSAPSAMLSASKTPIALDEDLTYNSVLICPFDYARDAIKQHIEKVVPNGVEANITAVFDLDDWKELRAIDDSPLSHLVLGLPDPSDVMDVLSYVIEMHKVKPVLSTIVVVADIYLKRMVTAKYKALMAAGISVFVVLKPVKPSSFSFIFDPRSERDLSKDRNQDLAREVNNTFKNMSKIVKEVIGNKGYIVLLVEDDETNRNVMLKYLDKVKLISETAANGQECCDMVFSKGPGYYSLILCDIQMPIKDGYETCREIRKWEAHNNYPEVPILALSANAMLDQIDDAKGIGFNDYVTKPIKHNELGKMMMELLVPIPPSQDDQS